VAQASSSWQELINQLPHWSLPAFKTGSPKQRNSLGFSGSGKILWFLTIVVAMLLWNWKLLLALLVGVGVMLLVYSMQAWDWHGRWLEIRKFLNSPNRRLVLAVGSGGIATVSTYTGAAIWVDTSSHWMAVGAIAQGSVTLLTLILLVWQILHLHTSQQEGQLERLLLHLTETDPLKRLIAVQQLTKLIIRQRIDTSQQQEVSACLQILLSREEETVIRDAAFESLQALDRLHVLPSSTAVPLRQPKLKIQRQKSQVTSS
jgi:hypothetical protein